MEEVKSIDTVFMIQHPLANPKDPPVAIPTLSSHRQQGFSTIQVPPTPTSLPYSLSPPGSPLFGAKSTSQSTSYHHHSSRLHHYQPQQHSTSSTGPASSSSLSSTAAAVPVGGASIFSSKALNAQQHPVAQQQQQMSLARDLTTRLWQREAELQTMKELYDAKIRRLTEMLQDAGVSPTEVENNLAVVVEEETDEKLPLFDQLSVTSDHVEQLGITARRRGASRGVASSVASASSVAVLGVHGRVSGGEGVGCMDEDPLMGVGGGLFGDDDEEEDCSSSVIFPGGAEGEGDEDNEDGGEDDPSEFMSSSGSLSLQSSCTTQLTKPDLSRHTLDTMQQQPLPPQQQQQPKRQKHSDSPSPPTSAKGPSALPTTSRRRSRPPRPFSPTTSDISTASHPVYSSSTLPYKSADQPARPASSLFPTARSVEAKAQNGGSQSPIPSFLTESLAAGTLGMKTLREKWALASGVLSWNKPKSEQSTSHSRSSSIVTSPSGLFIRSEGIMNDKKPALVETCLPSPWTDNLAPLSERRFKDDREREDEEAADKELDIWSSIVSPTSKKVTSNKNKLFHQQHQQHLSHSLPPTRPMSEVGTMGSLSKYPALTMARDIPRPPISRIHDYLLQPDSYSPSPLHYRAISMAANLIDTGAITPARLYARRTQTMIAKWTLGLIMNSKSTRSNQSSFPIIRESLSSEQEALQGHSHSHERHGSMDDSTLEMVSSLDRRSGALNPTELPKALSFKSHAMVPNLSSSSYPHSSSSLGYQQHIMVSSRSVVELSDISSLPLSMSPTFSYLGLGEHGKPLTDRYGFLVNARPMAVQQGLMKLNETYAGDDMESPSFYRAMRGRSNGGGSGDGGKFEYLRASPEESERSSSPPPLISSFYFGHTQPGSGVTSVTGNATTSATSLPTSVTSPILSTGTRPTSTLSPPTSSSSNVTALLSQIKVLHDNVQMTQKEKWDAFLRKRRRRVHLGETNGGALANMSSSNLGSPLIFGNLMLSLEEHEQDEDDRMYWSSVCIIGMATIGQGADWEELRELVRGGIPVMYRNKIWQEASGAYDMRQPGYYRELLSRQPPEECQCWGDIEMDLHRTFPTNVLFSPGGQGIEKLKNILLAYSIHNPLVGYCQGMNLLAGTLLLTNNTEEESFWILVSMLGRRMPEDYFTQQLLSPQADQRVLKELVQEIMPRLSQHFQEMHVDLTAVTFSWFLTLFTDCLPVETLLRVWDVFFVEGMMVVFKIAVAILWMNEKDILKCRNGAAVYCYMKQMTLVMHQADKLMKVAFVTLKSSIHPEKIEAKRQRHQRSVRQEILQEQQMLKMRAFTCVSPTPTLPPISSPSPLEKKSVVR
ncbi:hypothetical protein BGZ95_008734 [Linnemannia exigua]|uniref:Rab-GAP TBC domain-containing protein n=1 Tax=Linnemannia exigua TaxID=604196 RepID=A0AAD4DDQ7_9FUNG|nr:hypothetical protein BGZ95_008734 [Linnemannia exigua]